MVSYSEYVTGNEVMLDNDIVNSAGVIGFASFLKTLPASVLLCLLLRFPRTR